MRKRLALLATAAIVFAPAWGDGDAASSPQNASDLAGLILAPTFEEANTERVGTVDLEKPIVRIKPQLPSNKFAAALAADAPTQVSAQLVIAAAVALASFALRLIPSAYAQRAPPLLTA